MNLTGFSFAGASTFVFLATFNFAIVAVAVVLIYSGGYWFLSAKNWFRYSRVQGTVEELAKIEAELGGALVS